MTRFGLAFDGFMTAPDALDLAIAAEQAGARSFWFAEHMGYREAVISCMAIAMRTAHASLVPTAVSPYLWHPTPTAMALATMAELAPGRVGVAIGAGNPLFLQESGKSIAHPVEAVSEFIDCLRGLWSGEPVHFAGDFFTLNGARCAFTPPEPIPIHVAGIGPRMLEMAGMKADGLSISAGMSRSYVELTLERLAAGARKANRPVGDLRTSIYIMICVSDDVAEARAIVREKLAFGLRNKYVKENIDHSGIAIDLPAIAESISRRDLAGAAALVPEEAIDAFAVTGSQADCRARLEDWLAMGFDEIVLFSMGNAAHQRAALELISSLVPGR